MEEAYSLTYDNNMASKSLNLCLVINIYAYIIYISQPQCLGEPEQGMSQAY